MAIFPISPFYSWGFPGGSVVKNLPANAGDSGSIPELGRSLGEGNDNSLQDSCLENSTDRGAWWATVHGVAKTEHIGMHACYFRTWPLPRFWSLLALHLNLGGTFDSL